MFIIVVTSLGCFQCLGGIIFGIMMFVCGIVESLGCFHGCGPFCVFGCALMGGLCVLGLQ